MTRRKKPTSQEQQPDQRRGRRFICAALVLVTAAVYSHACSNEFVNFDDTFYATENHRVQAGLTLDNVCWAVTSTEHANWHPLTWLSLQLDATLYGQNAAGFHATNVLLHIANTVMLFWMLQSATGTLAASGFAAALFALHPLHVESVAWVSERKDLISGLFWLLTLAAYGRYAARPSIAWYAVAMLFFALGLAAKPMLVTLPFVLLLWDFWPLRRWPAIEEGERERERVGATKKFSPSLPRPFSLSRPTPFGRLLLEKVPFLALSVASCVITVIAQHRTGAIQSAEALSPLARLAHVPLAYVEYLAKTVWPHNLAVYYPFSPARYSLVSTLLAAALLVVVTLWTVRRPHRQPYLVVGWLWFLGTLVPVIGLVQVGGQAIADRYTYIPLIGVFITVAWGIEQLVGRTPRWLVTAGVAAALLALTTCTWWQIGYWNDSVTLWTHALQVVGPDRQVCQGLGGALVERARAGDDDQALQYLSAAVQTGHADSSVHTNLGVVFFRLRQLQRSQAEFETAMRMNGGDSRTAYNLGCVRLALGETAGAVAAFEETLVNDSSHWRAHLALAEILAGQRQAAEAQGHFDRAVRINPRGALTVWRTGHPDAVDATALAEQAAGRQTAPTEPSTQ